MSIRRLLIPLFLISALTGGSSAQDLPNELGTTEQEPKIVGQQTDGIDALPVSGRFRDPLANTVDMAINITKRRTLSTDVHTPWQIMHALLGMRDDFQVKHEGQMVNGLEWVSSGPKFEGEDWFQTSEWGGRAHPYSKPYAFEGHANQSLAILSMLGLPLTHELQAGDKTITIGDMIAHAKKEINDKEEVAWSLWSMSRYLGTNETWRNKDGEVWNLERMVELQLKKLLSKPMMKSPCGGTHAMFALAHARNMRLQSGRRLRGTWLRADMQIKKCIELARVQQNENGYFSSKFFDGRAYEKDFDKRIASSGHVLEFLMISLSKEELSAPWVRRGIEATARDIINNRQEYVKCAPLYHAINGLTIYLDRTQGQPSPSTSPKKRRPRRIAIRPASFSPSKSDGWRKASRAHRGPRSRTEFLNQTDSLVPQMDLTPGIDR